MVLNMIYTFLEDNGYGGSLQMLQKESGLDFLLPKIKNGEWETVLANLTRVNLNEQLLYELYEQIVFELVEEGDSKIGKVTVNIMLFSSCAAASTLRAEIERNASGPD